MTTPLDIRPDQSTELLKELHILTRDGRLNQDSRRKLKQVNHLYRFIEPLLIDILSRHDRITLVDHGAGKSYLGFIIYDLFLKNRSDSSLVFGIESREELVSSSRRLADRLGFNRMKFLDLTVADSAASRLIPEKVDMVTALHACDTATDDAIRFALARKADHIVLVPCCQAEVAAIFRGNRGALESSEAIAEIWRHPLHRREFGALLTNVFRSLFLESHGYHVTVTELVGWEHSMKNELIIASYKNLPRHKPSNRLKQLLDLFGLDDLKQRFQKG